MIYVGSEGRPGRLRNFHRRHACVRRDSWRHRNVSARASKMEYAGANTYPSTSYEAMRRTSVGFMFSYGFRAGSQPESHIAIIDFVRVCDGKPPFTSRVPECDKHIVGHRRQCVPPAQL